MFHSVGEGQQQFVVKGLAFLSLLLISAGCAIIKPIGLDVALPPPNLDRFPEQLVATVSCEGMECEIRKLSKGFQEQLQCIPFVANKGVRWYECKSDSSSKAGVYYKFQMSNDMFPPLGIKRIFEINLSRIDRYARIAKYKFDVDVYREGNTIYDIDFKTDGGGFIFKIDKEMIKKVFGGTKIIITSTRFPNVAYELFLPIGWKTGTYSVVRISP